ncbi:hypothetical protein GCM10027456_62600 [Kineosporia babensis]
MGEPGAAYRTVSATPSAPVSLEEPLEESLDDEHPASRAAVTAAASRGERDLMVVPFLMGFGEELREIQRSARCLLSSSSTRVTTVARTGGRSMP